MNKLLPKKLSYFPLYIFIYWIVIWGIVLIFLILQLLITLTPDGRYIEKVNCKAYKEEDCIQYSKKYYVPVGHEIRNVLIGSGIKTGTITILVGYSWFLYSWKKKTSKTIS